MWISLVTGDGQLLPVRGSTAGHAGDQLLALVDSKPTSDLA
jgi:hypothetical protein